MQLLPNYEQYHRFRRLRLPPPPDTLPTRILEMLRPDDEPSLELHSEELAVFVMYIRQPSINPEGYSPGILNIDELEGQWIYQCCFEWRARYERRLARTRIITAGVKPSLTGALLGVLGFIGLDGAVDSQVEIIGAVSAAAARYGIPVPFATYEQSLSENLKLIDSIARKYEG